MTQYSSRPPGYETTSRQATDCAEVLPDGSTREVLTDGTVLITAPDPPHVRSGPPRATRAAVSARPADPRAAAHADLDRRWDQLLDLMLGH